MTTAADVRAGLAAAARKRKRGEKLIAEANEETGKWLRAIPDRESEDAISMAEASRLADVTRPTAYKLRDTTEATA